MGAVMSKKKRTAFENGFKPSWQDRHEQRLKAQYKKKGTVNGRKYYRIVEKTKIAENFLITTPYGTYNVPIPPSLANYFWYTSDYKWMKPKEATLLRLKGKRVEEDTPE